MLIILDLDGTLIDSSRDLAISTNATREQFGLTPLPQETINSYVGNGAAVLVRRAMGVEASDENVAHALAYFLEYYRTHALEHTRLYEGIREMIEEMAAQGHRLAVLTNKPRKISFDILEALWIEHFFFLVYGGDSLVNKKPDPEGILRIAQEAGCALGQTLMVGDSRVDIETARNAGVRSCGVAWGFQPETFPESVPDFLIERPDELFAVIDKLDEHGNLSLKPGV